MTIEVKVQPGARREALVPWRDGQWKLSLNARAVDGKANEALIDFFAQGLRIARSRVNIISGETSRQKRIALDGVTEQQFRSWVEQTAGYKADPS